ncbi:MAG TPA: YeeE/YedE family protein [Gammaproteobacteria bacterium]
MTIDWINFTPWLSLTGGLLIGFAAVVFLLFNGRIAGISGILGGLFEFPKGDIGWRAAFLFGLLISPLLYRVLIEPPVIKVETNVGWLIIAGILVGFGTRLGSGCTSGHGVCGLSLGSRRSIVATAVFMIAGMGTVYMVRHVLGA